jgi:hypothetical protein
MDQLSLGVMARSQKENERRPAIHPLHIERIEAGLRRYIYLERGRTHHSDQPPVVNHGISRRVVRRRRIP